MPSVRSRRNLRFLRWLGEYAIFEPLRDKLGLTRARNVLTAGAMLSSDIIRFFRAIGIELRQFYGSTETFGTVHLRGDVRFETVGVIVPGVEIKIAQNQEILIRTKARFKGYYKQPEKPAQRWIRKVGITPGTPDTWTRRPVISSILNA